MLTSTATAGFVLAGIFGSFGVWALLSLGFTLTDWYPGAPLALVGLAYLHSSVRLSRTPGLTSAEPPHSTVTVADLRAFHDLVPDLDNPSVLDQAWDRPRFGSTTTQP